jgi:peptidoglycan hydrolase-like protein with peptidoglycan-binding domain
VPPTEASTTTVKRGGRPTTATVPPAPQTTQPPATVPPAPSHQVVVVQQLLNETGVTAQVPVDGIASQTVIDAIVAFQAAMGLPQTGAIDGATLRQLKMAALNAVLKGNWAGPVVYGGAVLGQLMAVVNGDGSTALSFSYSPCVGSSSFVDFDGVTLTSNVTLQSGVGCATITSGLAHLHFANINQLSWAYADGSSGTLTRL